MVESSVWPATYSWCFDGSAHRPMFANLTVKHVLDLKMKGQLHQISRDRWFRMLLWDSLGLSLLLQPKTLMSHRFSKFAQVDGAFHPETFNGFLLLLLHPLHHRLKSAWSGKKYGPIGTPRMEQNITMLV